MKKLLILFILIFLIGITGHAQTVAQDWTKTDCDGISHRLFDELDQGKVVLMQFDMMNCSYCTAAAYNTNQIIKDFGISNPGKVLMYSMGYSDATVCSDMKSWKSTNGFSFSLIEKCPAELAYYGEMGMPTIAIAAGRDHKIYYLKLGFNTSDNADIKAAIHTALAESAIDEDIAVVSKLSVYPNPANRLLHIDYALQGHTNVNIEVYNVLGIRINSIEEGQQSSGQYSTDINVENLDNGIYFLKINGNTVKFRVFN